MAGLGIDMFVREHHRRIAKVLEAMNVEALSHAHCFFGGGTAIAMQLGEYRESVDIDFLVRDEGGYRWLRNNLSENSLDALFKAPPKLARNGFVRIDRDGIRAFLEADDGLPIKFEIVSEARMPLSGGLVDGLPVPVLDRTSLFGEKLLANADRWYAPEVFSRDAIDLAHMMEAWGPIPQRAWDCAHAAYGESVDTALRKAACKLQDRKWLTACLSAMKVDRVRGQVAVGEFCKTFTSDCEADAAGQPPGRPRG